MIDLNTWGRRLAVNQASAGALEAIRAGRVCSSGDAVSRPSVAIRAVVHGILLASLAGLAHAQEAATTPSVSSDQNSAPLQEVVVTGSRIARKDYVADSPIVTATAQSLAEGGDLTLDNQLARLPQFTAGQGNGGQGSGQTATGAEFGNTGAATLNLRNLGDNRTLVLLDGRRMQPSTELFAVDINQLPASVIDSVEVITGGASATYGSDAVAGVVNFKLKHNFEGIQVDAHETAAQNNGYGVQDVSILTGTNFADHRGHVMVAVDYYNRNASLERDVPFYQEGMQQGTGAFAYQFLGSGYYEPFSFATTPGGTSVLNIPAPPLMAGAVGAPAALAGAFVTPTLALGINGNGTLFNRDPLVPGGSIYNYQGGVYPQNPLYALNNGLKYNANYDEFNTTPMTRYSVFANSEFEINDHITAYTQGLFTHYTLVTNVMPLPADNFWNVQIPFNPATDGPGGGGPNPVPASLYSLLTSRAVPDAPWAYGRSLQFMGPAYMDNTNNQFQLTAGLKGDIPGVDLTWDTYVSHGDAEISEHTGAGYASLSRYTDLMTAPNYGAGFSLFPGGPGCTSGISPFIADSAVSADCKSFLNPNATNSTTQKQDVVEGDLQGKIINVPAGEMRFAFGGDYRKNSYAATVDDAFQGTPALGGISADAIANFAIAPSAGALHVSEAYGELLVPVLKDLPAIKSLDLDLGYRYSDYSTSGGVNTYKADFNWALEDHVRFRGGFERAIRAPNVIEEFGATQATISLPAFDPCVSLAGLSPAYGNNTGNPHQAQVQSLCAAMTPGAAASDFANYTGQGTPVLVGSITGNPNLKPETADTYTFGSTFNARDLLPLHGNASASIDYYHIKVDGAIESLSADQVYQLCFNASGTSNPTYSASNPYCRLIVRAPIATGGVPATVLNAYENEGGIQTSGLDFQGDLSFQVGPGTLDFNLLVNYLIDYKTAITPQSSFLDYAGSIGSAGAYFRTRTLLSTSYTWGPVTGGVRWQHDPGAVDSGRVTGCGPACLPGVPSYNKVDLFAQYQFNKSLGFMAGIDNVANQAPLPLAGVYGNTDPGEYDVLGRTFWVSVKLQFN